LNPGPQSRALPLEPDSSLVFFSVFENVVICKSLAENVKCFLNVFEELLKKDDTFQST
jgi:hypothetical protein